MTSVGRRAAILLIRGLLLGGPLAALLLVSGPEQSSADAADPSDQAITEFLSATGAGCYVYGTTTFDPVWLRDVLDQASEAFVGAEQWIVEGEAWLGSSIQAALGFQAATIAQGPDAQWVLKLDAEEPRAIELQRYEAAGGEVWISADFVAAADCKDNEF